MDLNDWNPIADVQSHIIQNSSGGIAMGRDAAIDIEEDSVSDGARESENSEEESGDDV